MRHVFGTPILAFTLLAFAAPSSALGSTPEDAEGYRCETVRVTGSLIKRKVCTTAEQRARMRAKGRDDLFRLSLRASQGVPSIPVHFFGSKPLVPTRGPGR